MRGLRAGLAAVLVPFASGCFAATIETAPPRDEWFDSYVECDTSSSAPGIALGLATASGLGAAYLVSRGEEEDSDSGSGGGLVPTSDLDFGPSNRDLGIAFLAPVAGIFLVDALIGFSRLADCREYRGTWAESGYAPSE